jgi:hypothetical protein
MPRTPRKPVTATIDPNLVNISDFCQSQGISEQIFRLELMQHCDDADSTKTCAFDLATSVASTIQNSQPALPQNLEIQEIPENLTPQELQPSQELASEEPQSPQNSSLVGNAPKSLSTPPAGSQIPTALTEFINKSQDDIDLFDLVQVYRNQQIIENAQTRDQELVMQLREQRLENRALVFDQLRDLNARQPLAPDLPELPSSLRDEIKALSNELGKQLSA